MLPGIVTCPVVAHLAQVYQARSEIVTLEKALFNGYMGTPITNFEPYLRHFFQDGVYVREMTIPKGMCVVGKIHKHGHVSIISKGKVLVKTDTGLEEFTGPYTFISTPGAKRAVYALEDTVWTTIHYNPENLETQEELEVLCTYPSYEAMLTDQKK